MNSLKTLWGFHACILRRRRALNIDAESDMTSWFNFLKFKLFIQQQTSFAIRFSTAFFLPLSMYSTTSFFSQYLLTSASCPSYLFFTHSLLPPIYHLFFFSTPFPSVPICWKHDQPSPLASHLFARRYGQHYKGKDILGEAPCIVTNLGW